MKKVKKKLNELMIRKKVLDEIAVHKAILSNEKKSKEKKNVKAFLLLSNLYGTIEIKKGTAKSYGTTKKNYLKKKFFFIFSTASFGKILNRN